MSGWIATEIGRSGEQIVKNLLPKSKWLNEAWENCKPWDLEWKGLKIDVKTTTVKIGKAFKFGTVIADKEVVYVFVGIDVLKNYFWVYQGKAVRWQKISNSVPNLKKKLLELSY